MAAVDPASTSRATFRDAVAACVQKISKWLLAPSDGGYYPICPGDIIAVPFAPEPIRGPTRSDLPKSERPRPGSGD